MKSSTVTDRLFTLLKNMAAQKPTGPEADLPTIEELTGSAPESDMTSVEIDNTKLHLALLKIASLLSGSKSVPAEELDGLLTQVEEWLTSTSQTLSSENSQNPAIFSETAVSLQAEKPSALPSWLYLHHSFSVLETLKAVSLLVSVSARKTSKSTPKIAKDRADRLVALVRQIHDAIKTNTRALKSRVQEPGVLSALVDLVVAGDGEQGGKLREALESLLDTAALEVFCGALMESWEEGLDGVLAVTV